MHRLITATLAVMLAASMTACSPLDRESEPPNSARCPDILTLPPAPLPGPAPAAGPGQAISHIQAQLVAQRIVNGECDNAYRTLALVHVYATTPEGTAFYGPGGQLPYDGTASTPYSINLFLRYDPQANPAPVVAIDFSAKQSSAPTDPLPGDVVSFGCMVRVGGRWVLADVKPHPVGGDFVRCQGNVTATP